MEVDFASREPTLDYLSYLRGKTDFSKGKKFKYLTQCIDQLNFSTSMKGSFLTMVKSG